MNEKMLAILHGFRIRGSVLPRPISPARGDAAKA